MCTKLQKELVIDLDVQQSHHLGYDWTNKGLMFLHYGTYTLISSIDVVTDIRNLNTIGNADFCSFYCNYTS